jgi:hypothetical protein
MPYAVVVGIDAVGEFPMLLHDDDIPPAGHLRFRWIGQTSDRSEAVRMVEREERRIREAPRRPVDWTALEHGAADRQ